MPNVFNTLLRSPITKDGTYEWDPLISGYFFFQLTKLPDVLSQMDATLVSKQFMALCTALTLPDVNITPVERIGLGGVRTVVPAALEQTTTFEVRLLEIVRDDSMPPIIQLLATWSNSIRNHFAGVADAKTAFSMNQYKGHAIFLATDPSITVCAFAVKLYGLWPQTIPYSGYTADVATNDLIEYSSTFAVDRSVVTDASDKDAAALLDIARTTIDQYRGTVPFTVS